MPVFAAPKPESRDALKGRLSRLKAKADRVVYQHVTLRDMGCRACGETQGEMHRHHLRGREATTVEDVCLLCDACHERLHVRIGGKTLRVSGNANQCDRHGRPNGLTVEWRRADGSWLMEGER